MTESSLSFSLSLCMFFWNGQIPASLFILSLPHDIIEIDESMDGVLGTWTQGDTIQGADESTELRRHPILFVCVYLDVFL